MSSFQQVQSTAVAAGIKVHDYGDGFVIFEVDGATLVVMRREEKWSAVTMDGHKVGDKSAVADWCLKKALAKKKEIDEGGYVYGRRQ